MNKKIIHAIIFGVVFTFLGYIIFRRPIPAVVWGGIMFLSVMVKKDK